MFAISIANPAKHQIYDREGNEDTNNYTIYHHSALTVWHHNHEYTDISIFSLFDFSNDFSEEELQFMIVFSNLLFDDTHNLYLYYFLQEFVCSGTTICSISCKLLFDATQNLWCGWKQGLWYNNSSFSK